MEGQGDNAFASLTRREFRVVARVDFFEYVAASRRYRREVHRE